MADAECAAPAAAESVEPPSESVPGETDLLIEIIAQLRQKKYQMALNLCRQVLGVNEKHELMAQYEEVLAKIIKQEEEEAAAAGDEPPHSPKLDASGEKLSTNNKAHVVEVLTELLGSLQNLIHDGAGSSHRRASVLPFEDFVYPDYDPNAQDDESYGSDEVEEED